MQAYSMDLRQRVFADSDEGMKTRAVAAKYRVSESWVRRLKQRRAATGETAPRSPRNRRVSFRQRYADQLRFAVTEVPDRTLEELRRYLGVRVSIATVWQALIDLKLSWKKSHSARRSRTARM